MFSIDEFRFTSISRKQTPFCCIYGVFTLTPKFSLNHILVVYVAGTHLPFELGFQAA